MQLCCKSHQGPMEKSSAAPINCCTAVQVADPSLTLLMIYVIWPAKECSLGWGGFEMSACTQR